MILALRRSKTGNRAGLGMHISQVRIFGSFPTVALDDAFSLAKARKAAKLVVRNSSQVSKDNSKLDNDAQDEEPGKGLGENTHHGDLASQGLASMPSSSQLRVTIMSAQPSKRRPITPSSGIPAT